MKPDTPPLLWAAAITLVALVTLITLNTTFTDRSTSSVDIPLQGTWQTGTPLPQARRVMCAVARGEAIYVIGGVDEHGAYVRETAWTSVGADGHPGTWRRGSPLLADRFYHACVAWRDWIYVLGGGGGPLGDDNIPLASVERARIRADGSLGPFEPMNDMVLPRRGVKAVQWGEWLYAIGGYDGRFLKSTERARLLPDGSLGPWQLEAQESVVDRYIHSATASGARLILLGGHMRSQESPSYGDVETTSVDASGHLAPWRVSLSSLLQPRFMATAVTLGDSVYLLGGHNGVQRLASVEYARLNLFGEPEQWLPGPPLPQALSGAAALGHNDYLYLLGGVADTGLSAQVYLARQAPHGGLQAP